MLYSEFIEGTGCKDNDYNYQIYKNLEIMYMNSNLPKSTIYEYGKKLVNNEKSEKELALEAQLKAEIAMEKKNIEGYKKEIEYRKVIDDKRMEKYYKERIKESRCRIKELKFILQD